MLEFLTNFVAGLDESPLAKNLHFAVMVFLTMYIIVMLFVHATEGYSQFGKGYGLNNCKCGDVYGQYARFYGQHDHTGAGANYSNALAERWAPYTDDSAAFTNRSMPVAAYWPPTSGLAHYQDDYAQHFKQYAEEMDLQDILAQERDARSSAAKQASPARTDEQLSTHLHGAADVAA